MELDNHITQLGLQLQKLLERTEKGKRGREIVSIVPLTVKLQYAHASQDSGYTTLKDLNLLVRTLLCRSCLSKEARAHRPPYTATVEGERSWERGGSDGGEGEGVRGSSRGVFLHRSTCSVRRRPGGTVWPPPCTFCSPFLPVLRHTSAAWQSPGWLAAEL